MRPGTCCLLLCLAACRAVPESHPPLGEAWLRDGQHAVFAVYDNQSRLVNMPVEGVRRRFAAADDDHTCRLAGALPGEDADPYDVQLDQAVVGSYTDVFVVCHGWNFTIPEAIENFSTYTEGFDSRRHELAAGGVELPPFRPLVVFIAWDSISRPLQDMTSSVLPFGLGRVVHYPALLIDSVAFHLPSAWQESLKALDMAVGRRAPMAYRGATYADVLQAARDAEADQLALGAAGNAYGLNPWDAGDASGADVPVSMLLREILALRRDRLAAGLPGFRLHAVGHSYGAKIMALSSMEAMAADDAARAGTDPIDSLVLIQPAMHLEELTLEPVVGVPESGSLGHAEALAAVPRKALVYSADDYPNGALFDLSELLFSKRIMGLYAYSAVNEGLETDVPVLREAGDLATGVLQLGFSLLGSITLYPVERIGHLLPDWGHHITHNETFGGRAGDLPWYAQTLNTLHFWVPLEQAWLVPRGADQGGITRYNRPAIGYAGLWRGIAGREWAYDPQEPGDVGVLAGMIGPHADFDRPIFERFANLDDHGPARPGFYEHDWEAGRFDSFDATHVFEGHGALRSRAPVDDHVLPAGAPPRSPRDFAIDFVVRAAIEGR